MGADCILLIVAALDDAQHGGARGAARTRWAWTCWSRCTTARNWSARCALKTPLLGINNRNLRTFEVSLRHHAGPAAAHSAGAAGGHRERNTRGRRTSRRCAQADVNAFLVGEAFMRADDPGAELARIFG